MSSNTTRTELELADDVDGNSGICRVCNLPYKDAGLLKRFCWGMKAEEGGDANASAAVRFVPVDVVNSETGMFRVGVGDEG
jgi:hypothetical protein